MEKWWELRKRKRTIIEDSNEKQDNCILGANKDSELEAFRTTEGDPDWSGENRGVPWHIYQRTVQWLSLSHDRNRLIVCGQAKSERLQFLVHQAQWKSSVRCGNEHGGSSEKLQAGRSGAQTHFASCAQMLLARRNAPGSRLEALSGKTGNSRYNNQHQFPVWYSDGEARKMVGICHTQTTTNRSSGCD